jgi:general secretion pathway protein A
MYAGLLSGEIGCGKSITGRVLATSLDPRQFAVVVFENAHFRFAEHARRLARAAGLVAEAAKARTVAQVYELVAQSLERLHDRDGRHVVLVFDEAQDLRTDTLADLKRLLNFNDDGRARLTLILMGQPEVRACVQAHPPLEQRISLRFHLGPMSPEDCAGYLRHRLRVAGHPDGSIFLAAAEELLAAECRGVPRELNRLAKLALETARADGAPAIAASHVRAVIDDLRRHGAIAEAVVSP